MNLPRFFVDEPLLSDSAILADAESHHLLHVLRLAVGADVCVFNGRGQFAHATVRRVNRRSVELSIVEHQTTPTYSGPRLTIASAVPKGHRFRWMVEKLTELGVDRLAPIHTQRSVVSPGNGKQQRVRQAVIEACKQCGRNELMTVDDPLSLTQWLANRPSDHQLLIAHPGDGVPPLTTIQFDAMTAVTCVVGPEGGLTPDEINRLCDAGGHCVSVGQHILRIETAAIAVASIVNGAVSATDGLD